MREFLKEINRIWALGRCWQDVRVAGVNAVKREQSFWLIFVVDKGGVLFALIQ